MSSLFAQSNLKSWDEGKLTWADFTEKQTDLGTSELKYFLGYKTERSKFGDTLQVRIVAYCSIDRMLSWVNPQYKTEQTLLFNQVVFDLVEIHRRKLQWELDMVRSVLDYESKYWFIINACSKEIDRYTKESNGGQDLSIIHLWQQKVTNELNVLPIGQTPNYTPTQFGYGMHFGIGSGLLSGSLGKHFGPTFNFTFGFEIAYGKSFFLMNGTLAGDKVLNEYISSGTWDKGQTAAVAILDLSYGYSIPINPKIKITPFVGLGITEFNGVDYTTSTALRLVDYNASFGLNADYKLRTLLNLIPTPFWGVKEKLDASIRARIYVNRAKYFEDLRGYSINLSIGFSGFGNFLRINKK
jgi:hypothetical protein